MLDLLFSSSTCAELIALLIKAPDDKYYVREIAKLLKRNPSGVKKELDKLEKMKIVFSEKFANLKYFQINKTSPHYTYLKSLLSDDKGVDSLLSELKHDETKDIELSFMSSTRADLITLFIKNPDDKFYIRETAKLLKRNPSGVKKELDNLLKMGIIISERTANLRYFQINKISPYYLKLKPFISTVKETLNLSSERDEDITNQNKKHLIQNFLQGNSIRYPDTQEICDWITFSYENEMYKEGYELFKLIDELSFSSETYKKLRKLADACKVKLE